MSHLVPIAPKLVLNKSEEKWEKCQIHNQKKLKFYCKKCEVFACTKCLIVHKSHDFIEMEEFVRAEFMKNDPLPLLESRAQKERESIEFYESFIQKKREYLKSVEDDINQIKQQRVDNSPKALLQSLQVGNHFLIKPCPYILHQYNLNYKWDVLETYRLEPFYVTKMWKENSNDLYTTIFYAGALKHFNDPKGVEILKSLIQYKEHLGIIYFLLEQKEKALQVFDVNDPIEQFLIGLCHLYGKGVEKNIEQAMMWFNLSFQVGNSTIQNFFGVHHLKGTIIQKDDRRSFELFTMSSKLGNLFGRFFLGTCYFNGNGVEVNYREAYELFRVCSEKGYSSSQYNLGIMFENGMVVKKDLKRAYELYKLSAEQENFNGQFKIAKFYEEGMFVEKNLTEALKWYQRSAERGFIEAIDALKRYGIKID